MGKQVSSVGRVNEHLREAINYIVESEVTLSELARQIRKDWKKVNYAAVPYLDAMSSLDSISDSYGQDSGKSIVLYFLSNASSWKGPEAKRIKAILNAMLKGKKIAEASDEEDEEIPGMLDEKPSESNREKANKVLSEMGAKLKFENLGKSEWGNGARKYSVTITKGKNKATTQYHVGSGIKGDPELPDVVWALLMDKSAGEVGSLDDFMSEFGYEDEGDGEGRKQANKIYKACQKNGAVVSRLFSASEISKLERVFDQW